MIFKEIILNFLAIFPLFFKIFLKNKKYKNKGSDNEAKTKIKNSGFAKIKIITITMTNIISLIILNKLNTIPAALLTSSLVF